MAKGSNGFGGYEEAMEMRDIIDAMVRKSLDSNRPAPTYARVYTIDLASRTCMVIINGDTVAVKATCGSIMPSAPDQIVRLEGPPGGRYIADVLGVSELERAVFAPVAWQTASLATGFTHVSGNNVQYRKVNDSGSEKIQLRGACNVNSPNATVVTIWTMPVGYRKSVYTSISIARNISGGSNTAVLGVNPAGTMVLDGKTVGVQASSGQQTGIGGGAARTSTESQLFNHNHKFLNLEFGQTDAYRNADNNYHQQSANTHSHLGGDHQHPLLAVTAPTSISLDGIEYFL